jgi:hypothetical protein
VSCYRKRPELGSTVSGVYAGKVKSFVANVPSVANQRIPTSAALRPRKFESLLLRLSQNDFYANIFLVLVFRSSYAAKRKSFV